jgi:HD superfamily phosphohydrolase
MLNTVKRVADPVHGTIGLTDLEVQVLDTRTFQRLRNVKQLGLASLIFPGADYSRLSHCLGRVCKMLSSSRTMGERAKSCVQTPFKCRDRG